MNELRFKFLSVDEATKPTKGFYFHPVRDSWWVVDQEKGLAFVSRPKSSDIGSPQCNTNEQIITKLAANGLYPFPYDVKFFDLVWVPVEAVYFKQ